MVRYLQLALLAIAASTTLASDEAFADRMLQGDFEWDITPEYGYPTIAFDEANDENEVVFKYNFTGAISQSKYLAVGLFQADCNQTADASLNFIDSTIADELTVDVDIVQETIAQSVHYTDVDQTSAKIDFCVRVDYMYDDGTAPESINFHETKVTINVDLTANFTLESIIVDRDDADERDANAELDYPVIAYFCGDDDVEINNPTPLTQGSALQFCVKVADNVTADVYVEDILSAVLSQPGSDTTNSQPITGSNPDALTDKNCLELGICNVKTQLASKWFSEIDPNPLRVDGVALLALGVATAAPASSRRRLRVPIRGYLKANKGASSTALATPRQLQSESEPDSEPDSSEPESPFDMEVLLVTYNVQAKDEGSSGDSVMILIVVIVVCIVFSLAGCTVFGIICFWRKKKSDEDEQQKNQVVVAIPYETTAASQHSAINAASYSENGSKNTHIMSTPEYGH